MIVVDSEVSTIYRPMGNDMAEDAMSNFKTILKKNGFNNCTSSITWAGSASERLLGQKPRFDLPMISKKLAEGEREAMIRRVKENCDKVYDG